MIIAVLCIVILCRRSCRKKSSDAGNQVSQRKTELNTAISKTNPIYDAIIKPDGVDNKQGSDVPITINPSYKVSTKSSIAKMYTKPTGEDEDSHYYSTIK